MIYILLSICFSVTVGVLIKFSRRYSISIPQAITFNYLSAIGLSLCFFEPTIATGAIMPVGLYVALGCLLPTIFWIMARAVQEHGIAKTDIAQRLSLFIGIIAAITIFRENISLLKYIGLAVGLLSVFLVLDRKGTGSEGSHPIYLLLVFAGYGSIDILFKQLAKNTTIPYTTSLFWIFVLSFVLSIAWLTVQIIRKKQRLQIINIICGLILGFFNFGNIWFYLQAHRIFSENPSTVFASMNLGVIVAGSLIGILLFKERFNKRNYLGMGLALIAVIIITIAQFYAL